MTAESVERAVGFGGASAPRDVRGRSVASGYMPANGPRRSSDWTRTMVLRVAKRNGRRRRESSGGRDWS
jgi:hypothetical protein